MPFIPDTPLARKVAAGFLVVALGTAVWQVVAFFRPHEHVPPRPRLLYDLEKKVLAEYPPTTLPGSNHTAALQLFAKGPQYTLPAPGMTLEDLEKAGLRLGWLYRLDDAQKTGLYADPRRTDQWIPANSPEAQAQLNRWMNEAAAFSTTGQPIPCKN